MEFPAENAIKMDSSYWLSKRNVLHDHWEAEFDVPQKIDIIDIHWRLPPKRFRVFFKLDDKSDYIPATDVYDKSSFINDEGKTANQEAISLDNAIVFQKPIFAKRVRINLNEPVKSHSFSIFYVKFYQKRSTVIIKNDYLDKTKHYCFYVNTDQPREGVKVEAYPCLNSLILANNNELFVYHSDMSIRHYNSKLCVGFDVESNLVLRKCEDYNPAFVVQLKTDNSIYFKGYEDKCIYIDDSKKISNSFLSEYTSVLVTSEADNQTFKKDNLKTNGQNFWHSTPGQNKATVQILFGKITEGPLKGQYESRKIDNIIIFWIKQPKKFMLYTWKPGYSWILRETYENYKNNKSEISLVGEEAAAIMLILQESHYHDDLRNQPAYAIREVFIGYNSVSIKHNTCKDIKKELKHFDFDTQNYHKLEQMKPYIDTKQKLSIAYEKLIANYKASRIKKNYIEKAKIKSNELSEKIKKLTDVLSNDYVKTLKTFKTELISKISNPVFNQQINKKREDDFINNFSKKDISEFHIGTKMRPGIDCLSIKKLKKSVASGFFYIKPLCARKPLKVFCDFSIYKDAVDIHVFNDNSLDSDPDLRYLKIKDQNSVRYQCALLGLHPLQINNKETIERIYQVLTAIGYNLSKPIAVPLGYDYTCTNGRCLNIINSINDKQTPMINNFFKNSGGNLQKGGAFAGLGFSDTTSMITFNSQIVQISALICSTNHFTTDDTDTSHKTLSCESAPVNNGNIFTEGSTVLVECPSSCNASAAPVYGTNYYHVKSSVCKAAIHRGALSTIGGFINVRINKNLKKYMGSNSNGISSKEYVDTEGLNSFSLAKYTPNCPIDQFANMINGDEKEESPSINNASFVELDNNMKMQNESYVEVGELEGVDVKDIKNAGIKIKTAYKDDVEDFEYNKAHTDVNNKESMNSAVMKMIELNAKNNEEEDENIFNFKEKVDKSGVEITNDGAIAEEKMGLVNKYLGVEPTINKQEDQKENSNNKEPPKDINKSINEENTNDNNKEHKNANLPQNNNEQENKSEIDKLAQPAGDVPIVDEIVNSEIPDTEEKNKLNSGRDNSPSTDEANYIVTKQRQVVDWDYIKSLEVKTANIKKDIEEFKKMMSWSNIGSKLSNTFLKSK